MSDDEQKNEDAVNTLVVDGVLRPVFPVGAVEEATVLTEAQEARTTALYHARHVLERRGGPLAPTSANPPSVTDLVRVANYILYGDTVNLG